MPLFVAGGSIVIARDHLSIPPAAADIADPNQLIYMLVNQPKFGTLRLDGIALQNGDSITYQVRPARVDVTGRPGGQCNIRRYLQEIHGIRIPQNELFFKLKTNKCTRWPRLRDDTADRQFIHCFAHVPGADWRQSQIRIA